MSWIAYCMLVLLFWGIWAFLPRLATRTIDPASALFFQQIGALGAAIVVLAGARFRLGADGRGISLSLITGVLGVAGLMCYLQAVVRGRSLALVVMVTALYPVISVGLSIAVLRERLSGFQWLGVLFALAAITMLSLPSR